MHNHYMRFRSDVPTPLHPNPTVERMGQASSSVLSLALDALA